MRKRGKKYFFIGIALLVVITGALALNLGDIQNKFEEIQLSPTYTDLISRMLQVCEDRHSEIEYTDIYTCEDMKNIDRNLKGNYKLMNDIDCDFEPIAFRNGDFKGVFDGQGHTVNYSFDSDTHGKVGLFSDIGECGIVKNLHVDADIRGTGSVGAVAGYVYKGILKEVYSTGSVKANGQDAGGLIGGLKSGAIVDSYSQAGVFGNERVGGIVGAAWNFPNYEQRPIIKNSYANGNVLSEGNNVGGLAGLCDYPAISSYWNLDRYSRDNGCGIGKSDSEMKQQGTFVGWNFNEVWSIAERIDYPRLQWEADTEDTGSRYLRVKIIREGFNNMVSLLDIPSGQQLCTDKRESEFCFIGDKRIKIVEINYETYSRNATFEIVNEKFNRLYEYGSGNYMVLPSYNGFPRESQTFDVFDEEGGIMETWTWAWSDGAPWLQRHEYYYGNHTYLVRRSPRDAFLLDIEVTLKDGPAEIYAMYGDGLYFQGTGKGSMDRLAVSEKNTITYIEKDALGNPVDEAFILP